MTEYSYLLDPATLVAVATHAARKARRDHPHGSFDRRHRWYPSDSERRECCAGIRSPTAAYPNTLNAHCRSVPHVAHLHGVEPVVLRRALRAPIGKAFLASPSAASLMVEAHSLAQGWDLLDGVTREWRQKRVLNGLVDVAEPLLVDVLMERLVSSSRAITRNELVALLESPNPSVRSAAIQRTRALASTQM